MSHRSETSEKVFLRQIKGYIGGLIIFKKSLDKVKAF